MLLAAQSVITPLHSGAAPIHMQPGVGNSQRTFFPPEQDFPPPLLSYLTTVMPRDVQSVLSVEHAGAVPNHCCCGAACEREGRARYTRPGTTFSSS
eukprot:scaffold8500_cov55-Phaeocystis_antarctica.AAC.3